MEKRRKLNVELIKFLIGSMLVVGVLMLLGSSLVNNRQYRKLYNDKALEIAKTVSDQVYGDFIVELCRTHRNINLHLYNCIVSSFCPECKSNLRF